MYLSIARVKNLFSILNLSLNKVFLCLGPHGLKHRLSTKSRVGYCWFFLKDGVVLVSAGSLLLPSLLSGPPHGEGHIQFLSLPVRNINLPLC